MEVVPSADEGALVVDPERDPRPDLGELDRRGLVPRFAVGLVTGAGV